MILVWFLNNCSSVCFERRKIMSETETKSISPTLPSGNTLVTVQPPGLQVAYRMLRSPSHESVTTDLTLFSVSSIASDTVKCGNRLAPFKSYSDAHLSGRGPSPNPDARENQATRQAYRCFFTFTSAYRTIFQY